MPPGNNEAPNPRNGPSARDAAPGRDETVRLFDALVDLSRQVLTAGRTRDPQVLEAIMEARGELLARANAVNYDNIPPETLVKLRERMSELNELEAGIGKLLSGISMELDGQLKSIREVRETLGNYRLPQEGSSTHDDLA